MLAGNAFSKSTPGLLSFCQSTLLHLKMTGLWSTLRELAEGQDSRLNILTP